MKQGTCTEWLFFHIWKKNPKTGHSCDGIFVADTVIYRWAQPYFRYFTVQDGQIIRKTKERVFIDQVETSFQQDNTTAQLMTSQILNKQQEIITFEYLDYESFKVFLHQREKDLNLLLQKFIYPKNDQNSLIKVTWSPQFCLVMRKTNINKMNDTKKTLVERVATFDGPEYLIQSDSINSPLLSADLEQLCVNIVKHILEVSGGNIQIIRMVLYFKVDFENRIWLLFCTNIKVKDKFQENEQVRTFSPIFRVLRKDQEPVIFTKEQTQTVIKINNQGEMQSLLYQFENICSNCDRYSNQLYQLKLSYIIESFNQNLVKIDSTRLPEELQKIKMKQEKQVPKLIYHKNIKARSKQTLKSEFELQNQFEIQESRYEYLQENKKVVQNKLTEDEMYQQIKELVQLLDEEQEDQKFNFNHIPPLILKVWGKINEEKYKQLKNNQSWKDLTTQVCIDCFLQYTECYESTKSQRKAEIMAKKLRNIVNAKEENEKERLLLSNTSLNGQRLTFTQLPNLPSISELPLGNTKFSRKSQNFTLLENQIKQSEQTNQKNQDATDNQKTKESKGQNDTTQKNSQIKYIKKQLHFVPTQTFSNKSFQLKKQQSQLDQNGQILKTPSTQRIYQNRQGLNISLNKSSQSKSSRTTLDSSKIMFDFMLNTVSQLKMKLQELETEETLKNVQKQKMTYY